MLDRHETVAATVLLFGNWMVPANAAVPPKPPKSAIGTPAANSTAPTLLTCFLLANGPPLIAWPALCPLASHDAERSLLCSSRTALDQTTHGGQKCKLPPLIGQFPSTL